MPRISVVHWNPAEAGTLVEALRSAGHQVEYDAKFVYSASVQAWRRSPPDAFVIDLSRLPARGREIAIALRGSKATRQKPIVFVDGLPGKVDAIRKWLPDATYASNTRIKSAVRHALAHPPAEPVRPSQMMERFGGRTAAQKLGIREGSTVAVIDPPRDYAKVIGEAPPGATFHESADEASNVMLWFVHDPETYLAKLSRMRALAGRTKLWILWRKQAAGGSDGVTQNFLRRAAIAVGLVDYKICSVNQTWSGLAFGRKRGA